jgi:endonuclease/exonuclease/phosphatase (EEP) superfamily protein YafD
VTIDGTPVRVYAVHFGSPAALGPGGRRAQAAAVIDDARTWSGPVIIGGDLNSRGVGEEFEKAGFRWLTKSLRKTVSLWTFDHVFVRGLPYGEWAGDAEVARSCKGASDHHPVVARLTRATPPS